jgi:Tfp pilus assembly protein PilN
MVQAVVVVLAVPVVTVTPLKAARAALDILGVIRVTLMPVAAEQVLTDMVLPQLLAVQAAEVTEVHTLAAQEQLGLQELAVAGVEIITTAGLV